MVENMEQHKNKKIIKKHVKMAIMEKPINEVEGVCV